MKPIRFLEKLTEDETVILITQICCLFCFGFAMLNTFVLNKKQQVYWYIIVVCFVLHGFYKLSLLKEIRDEDE